MIQGLDNFVTLDKTQHRYFDKNGVEYLSQSAFMRRFQEQFNGEMIARATARSTGENPQDILDAWSAYGKERADAGTEIHNAIEQFFETGTSPKAEFTPFLLNIRSQYSHYYRVLNEIILYNTTFRIAGTCDTILLTTSHKNCVVDITDWKTNIKGITQKPYDKYGKPTNKYMLGPVAHLQDSKYNLYALQLSLYAYFLQQATGKKIGQLSIHYVNPNNPLINFPIPVPYLKDTIEKMLEWHINNPL